MTITFISVVVAFAVGTIEALGLAADHLHSTANSTFWTFIRQLNRNFGVLGYAIIAFFAASWIASIGFYRWRRYDTVDVPL
jgi:high-affinity nickel-transport protein